MSEGPPAPSADRVVNITYQVTLDDLREALKPPPTAQQRAQRQKQLSRGETVTASSKVLKFGRRLFGWVLFIGLAVMLFVLLKKTPRPGMGSNSEPAVDIWLTVVPSALGASGMGAFVLTIAAFSWLSNRRMQTSGPKASPRVMQIGLIVSLSLVAAAIWLMLNHPFDVDWRPHRAEVAIWSTVPWVVVFGLTWALMRVGMRRGTRKMFDSSPTFRRPHSLRIDGQGIHGDDGVTSTLYRWPCFTRAWETDNLLVLDDEARRRHMIPKRALLASDQLEVARSLTVTHVAESDLFFTPGAFPVNRPAQAPIPAIPVLPADHAGDGGRA